MFGKNKNQRKLEATMLSINTILREIYTNKSSDEFKMKGDITKSPSYSDIEKMLADLSTLRGYSKDDANALKQMFNTLHRPMFKSMVKEYIMEPNDRNTVFTSMFTIGYRLLVGELSRIYASTEATDKGIVYKPDKISRKEDAGKMIRLFNDDLEAKLDKCVRDLHADPNTGSPVNEAYLMEMFSMTQEGFGFREIKPHEKITDKGQGASNNFDPDARVQPRSNGSTSSQTSSGRFDPDARVKPKEVQEDGEPTEDTTPTLDSSDSASTETTDSDDSIQEGAITAAAAAIGSGLVKVGGVLKPVAAVGSVVVSGVAAIGAVLGSIGKLISGFNPIAQINYLFMNSYEKKIAQLNAVSANYYETKKAYEEYMKIPEAKRDKKVASKYVQNMNKYNVTMKNLAAEIEHYNQRAQKEADEAVQQTESQIPKSNGDSTPKGDDKPATQDDDFQF